MPLLDRRWAVFRKGARTAQFGVFLGFLIPVRTVHHSPVRLVGASRRDYGRRRCPSQFSPTRMATSLKLPASADAPAADLAAWAARRRLRARHHRVTNQRYPAEDWQGSVTIDSILVFRVFRVWRWFLFLWLLAILGATLIPLEPSSETPPILCVLCGEGSVADGLLNVMLFFPLGALLSAVGWRPLRALLLGVFLSGGLETAQFVIPGRDPSLADFLFNALGTALGIAIARSVPTLLEPGPRLTHLFAIAAAVGATFVLGMTGALLAPSLPKDTYYGGWTQRFGHLEWYGGRVLEASLEGLEIPPGVIARSAEVRQRLLAQATIYVRARAGPRPPGLAPLLTIHDQHQREILLLGVDGDDLVYRYRTRAIAYGLVATEMRAAGALRGVVWRDSLSIRVRRAGHGYCASVNTAEWCRLGYTFGTGWALVFGDQPTPHWLHPAFRFVWLAALFYPTGLPVRAGWAAVAPAALPYATLFILPAAVGLLPTPGLELLAAFAGFLAGWASRMASALYSRGRT